MQWNGTSSRVANIPIHSVSIRHRCDTVGCINLFNGKKWVWLCVCCFCVSMYCMCVSASVCVWVYDWEITYNAAFPSTTVLSISHPLPHCISLTYCQMKSSSTYCIVGEEVVWVFAGCFEKLEATCEKWPCFRFSLIRRPFHRMKENSMIKCLVNTYVEAPTCLVHARF